MLKYISKYILFFIGILPLSFNALSLQAQIWTSTADATVQLVKHPLTKIENTATIPSGIIKVKVNPQKTFQTIEGFGYALTGGSAQVIHHLSKEKRKALINEIFGPSSSSLGVSYIRISMGASDLDAEVFSYCDLPKNEVDPQLTHFNLSKDTVHLIPILKEILAIQPNIKIMASPWSAPIWMKSNGISMGGHLLKKYYASYALYFEKYKIGRAHV